MTSCACQSLTPHNPIMLPQNFSGHPDHVSLLTRCSPPKNTSSDSVQQVTPWGPFLDCVRGCRNNAHGSSQELLWMCKEVVTAQRVVTSIIKRTKQHVWRATVLFKHCIYVFKEQWNEFWDTGPGSCCRLPTKAAILQKLQVWKRGNILYLCLFNHQGPNITVTVSGH